MCCLNCFQRRFHRQVIKQAMSSGSYVVCCKLTNKIQAVDLTVLCLFTLNVNFVIEYDKVFLPIIQPWCIYLCNSIAAEFYKIHCIEIPTAVTAKWYVIIIIKYYYVYFSWVGVLKVNISGYTKVSLTIG